MELVVASPADARSNSESHERYIPHELEDRNQFRHRRALLIMVIILLLVWRDVNPLLGAIVGASLGWAAGILLAPYDEEKRRFERLSKSVAAFLGGYAVGKIDRVFDLLLDKSGGIPRVLDSSLQHAFWIALVCFIVTAVTVFVARTYD